ncbi:MAG: RidA family protein [Clostridiales bacterium]|nr:RidA family protein [Clostridiales bacterium]
MKTPLHTERAPQAIGPYVQGWKVGRTIYTSGQLGIDMATGDLAAGVEAQAHAAMKHMGEILKAGGAGYGDVVKTLVFLKDMGDFQAVNEIYAQYFPGSFPARSCVQVAALPKDALVEIECVAVVE